MQEVQRAAGTAKLLPARHGARLGREPVDGEAPLAEARGRRRLVVQVGAVQTAVDLGQLVVHVADLEVAPDTVVIVVSELHVELAERRRHLLDRSVVAERGVVIVGIDAPEQRVRRLVQEVAEEIRQRLVARIGTCRELPVGTELAVHVEGQACVGR